MDFDNGGGIYGQAQIITVFATVANSDGNAGTGILIDRTYHETLELAEAACIGIDIMGSDGQVARRLVVKFEDGGVFLLAKENMHAGKGAPAISFSMPTSDQSAEYEQRTSLASAYKKLKPAEVSALKEELKS